MDLLGIFLSTKLLILDFTLRHADHMFKKSTFLHLGSSRKPCNRYA